jgi:hypothetical protein
METSLARLSVTNVQLCITHVLQTLEFTVITLRGDFS